MECYVQCMERIKILRNQAKMASFSPLNALSKQSLKSQILVLYLFTISASIEMKMLS